jgi:membrane protein DedA with SNARE-associated domain
MVPLVRTFVSVPAGTASMDLRVFTIYTFAGSVVWASLLAAAGYVMGENWEELRAWMGPADIVVAALLGVFGIWYIWHNVKKAWEAPKPSEPEA